MKRVVQHVEFSPATPFYNASPSSSSSSVHAENPRTTTTTTLFELTADPTQYDTTYQSNPSPNQKDAPSKKNKQGLPV